RSGSLVVLQCSVSGSRPPELRKTKRPAVAVRESAAIETAGGPGEGRGGVSRGSAALRGSSPSARGVPPRGAGAPPPRRRAPPPRAAADAPPLGELARAGAARADVILEGGEERGVGARERALQVAAARRHGPSAGRNAPADLRSFCRRRLARKSSVLD